MTSPHIFDELPQLLTGEADRATVVSVAAHLRTCEDCCDELISAVVAHAALTSAARIAPSMATAEPEGELGPGSTDARSDVALPDLSEMFAQVRSEVAAEAQPAPVRSGGSGLRYRWVAAAIVAALAVGGGAVYAAEHTSSTSSTRSVVLGAYDQGTVPAKAQIVGDDQMKLDASSLPELSAGHYYEVWLTDAARQNMAPIGQLDASRMGTFTVPASEMGRYGAVEVSVQPTHGTGGYSGVSVLRGTYA